MSDDIIPRCILIIAMVFAASFFAAAETAYSYCNKVRIKALADEGNRRALTACRILNDFDGALVTLLIGINILSVLISSTATVLAITLLNDISFLSGYASVISTVLVTLTVFIFDETIPKNIAHVNADRMALIFSVPLWSLMVVLHPLVLFFRKISDFIGVLLKNRTVSSYMSSDELMRAVDSAEKTKGISAEEAAMIRSASSLRHIKVEDIITPAEKTVFIDAREYENNREKLREFIIDGKYSRYPLCDGDIGSILGVVTANDILIRLMRKEKIDLKAIAKKAIIVTPDKDTGELYDDMIKSRCHMAFAAENGRTLGIVTINDILGDLLDSGSIAGAKGRTR